MAARLGPAASSSPSLLVCLCVCVSVCLCVCPCPCIFLSFLSLFLPFELPTGSLGALIPLRSPHYENDQSETQVESSGDASSTPIR